tara:strand:- start:1105 stop:1848 length:744 start_codon:yes stop_codon:yes gene_type:complete
VIAELVSILDTNLAIACTAALVAGLIHGFAGFGVGLVLVPSLAILLGPVAAVTIAGITSIAATAQLIPAALQDMNWRVIWPILVAAPLTVIIGAHALVTIDPLVMRRFMGALVFVLGLFLMVGVRWRTSRNILSGLAVGTVGGFLGGSTSMGGPFFTAYILSSKDSARVMRGGALVVTTSVSIFTVAALIASNAVESDTVARSLILIAPNAAGIWVGAKLFGKSTDETYRRAALGFLLLVGIAAMIA